ncbi:hypothetical protein BUALT_Bualt05G0055600 [Buddleja alternifolia]|uniref:WAT1-related protein n=1 Tax=Buddleja alternifolia TaxID=168488 RepID=A0AAV6XIF1_9LAMI|nr:hypothetical protein BUALT_Bualt05G0055600 [Buddleja alternifolia]
MDSKLVKKVKPYLEVILLQFGYAGLGIIAKSALNQGMSHYTFSVYRNVVAAVVVAPFAFVLERPVIDQNLYYVGMKYTTATFTTSMCNIVPAITFLLAWVLRLERVNIKRLHSQAKIMGTLVTLGGAMIMTLVNGPAFGMPWTKLKPNSQYSVDETAQPRRVICSGVAYYVSGVALKEKGPVFVTSFNPLNMVIVAVMSSFILAEQLTVGKVTGAIVIVVGLYLVIWGKTKDQSRSFYSSSEMIRQQEESATNTTTKNEHIYVPKAISVDSAV